MPKGQDDISQAELLRRIQSLKDALDQFVQQEMHASPGTGGEGGEGEGGAAGVPQGSSQLEERSERHRKLIQEIERQSDAGAINLDELIRRYHQEYDRPTLMLAQDLQERAMIYSNVVESLKQAPEVETAARTLKKRYEELGLIGQENQWPNPLGSRLMRHALDKLSQFRNAMLELLRTRGRQLLRELNFDPSLAVALQLSLGTNTSFAITVQAQVTAVRE